MTAHYSMTKAMRSEGRVYKCIRSECGRVWTDSEPGPINYGKIPEYVKISGGLCPDCLRLYYQIKEAKR